MAEAVAAFYAVETVVEGAAAGALAVSGATVPLHARFQKIQSPSPALKLSGSKANIVKNKIYVFGGEGSKDGNGEDVCMLSLPPDFGSSRTTSTKPIEVDYELQKPIPDSERRPLQPATEHFHRVTSASKDQSRHSSLSRVQHGTAVIGDKVYIGGGLSSASVAFRTSNTENIHPLDTLIAYDTLTSSYTILYADPTKSTEGLPDSRYGASIASSPYPPPVSVAAGQGPSLDAHGTIFLHGGYDVSGISLHDTWTFDVGTRAWHKFPSIIEEALADRHSSGQIVYVEHRLWYINGATVMYLDLAEHDPETNTAASQDPATLSTGRVGSGQWQVVYPPPQDDPAAPTIVKESISSVTGDPPQTLSDAAPQGPTSNIVPITTGAGRTYLLSFGTKNPQEMYLFQIPSSPNTATSIKDTIRDKASAAISKLPDSWKSGKYEWSKIEVVQADMKEGEIERPSEELTDFAVAGWDEYGDQVVLWGGSAGSQGTKNEGWVINLS